MPGPSVTIVESGGIAVTDVASGAPVLTAVSSGGIAITLVSSGGLPFIVEGGTPTPAPTPTPTSSQSNMVQRGMTMTFDTNYPVGQYANGDYFAVGATVTNDSPAYALDAAGSWLFGEVEGTGGDGTITFQDTGDTVTKSKAHGLIADQKVRFTSITGTTGISINTDYFVRNPTSTTFQLAATAGGAILPLTTNGSGVMLRYGVNSRARNGLMVNPGSGGTTGAETETQGFDSLDSADAVNGSTIQNYAIANNAAPSRTGTPISGQNTLVKVISTTSPNLEGRENVTDMAAFTIVSAVPTNNSFRPHASDTDKTPFFQSDQMDLAALPSLAVPSGTSLPTKDAIISQLKFLQTFYTNNLFARGISASNNQRAYGGDIAASVAQALCYLCCTGPTVAEKQEVAVHLVQAGLDCWRRTVNSGRWPSNNASFGGGQHWVKPLIVFAAWALRNAPSSVGKTSLTNTADAAQNGFFQNDRTVIEVGRIIIETTPNTGLFPIYAPYLDFMENSLDWNSKPSSPASGGSAYNHRYRDTNGNPNMAAILALRAMGAIGLWNSAATMTYHDRYYQWWVANGSNTQRLLTDQSSTFLKRMIETYYTAQTSQFTDATAPVPVRFEARNRHVWIEFDKPLDQGFVPAVSAFAVVVAGSPVTLPIDRSTTCSSVVNTAAVTVASGTGIVQGMRANRANFPVPTQVSAVSGTSVTLSTSADATTGSATITFSSVHVWGNSLAITLDTPLTTGQSVTIAYTQPGTNNARALGGGLVPSFTATTATNRTGALPDAVTTKEYVDTRKATGTAQWSTMNVPASETIRRMRGAVRFVIFNKTVNMVIFNGGNGGTTQVELYASTAADMRMLLGSSHSFRMPGALTAMPTGQIITFYFALDFTQTTAALSYRGVFRWNGGEHVPTNVGSTGVFDGNYAPNIATLFQSPGLTIGANGNGADPLDGAFGEFTLGWGDSAYSLPANFSGSEFNWDADWGGNGQNPFGQNQLYFAGSIDDYNGGVNNAGNGGARALTPRNINLATEDLAIPYVVWP